MEERALETLRAILARRDLPTTTTPLGDGIYSIGNLAVVFYTTNSLTNKGLESLLKDHPKDTILVVERIPVSVEPMVAEVSKDGIQVFTLRQLQFDIMTHAKYGFPCRILTQDEKTSLLESLRIKSPRSLPRVLYSDPYALWVGAKPEDIIEYQIPSEAAGVSKKYRYVVTNVDDV